MAVAFVTGGDRGLGLALCAGLLERGYQVFAGQYMPDWPELGNLAKGSQGRLTTIALDVASTESVQAAAQEVGARVGPVDVLINNAGVYSPTTAEHTIREKQDYEEMHRLFNINSLGPLRVVEAFLPLVERSAMKRLCFVSSEAGSIARSYRKATFGYCMSKSALNMAVKNLFNDLRPQGFTFRVYHPGWVRSYMSGSKNMDAHLEPDVAAVPALNYFLGEIDEDNLVLRDYQGQDWPW